MFFSPPLLPYTGIIIIIIVVVVVNSDGVAMQTVNVGDDDDDDNSHDNEAAQYNGFLFCVSSCVILFLFFVKLNFFTRSDVDSRLLV